VSQLLGEVKKTGKNYHYNYKTQIRYASIYKLFSSYKLHELETEAFTTEFP